MGFDRYAKMTRRAAFIANMERVVRRSVRIFYALARAAKERKK
jgi:hypothetical protein